MIIYIILIIFSLLFVLASRWEIADDTRVKNLPRACDIKSPKDRELHYMFLAKFPYENTVGWRMLYITSFITVLILWLILHILVPNFKMTGKLLVLMFIATFLSFYLSNNFKMFHFFRVLASKADPHIKII